MKKYIILGILFILGLVVSAIHPKDYFTWILEVFPAIIGFIVLLFSFKKFRFTYLTYCFILIHCYILFIGGHYTYAEVTLFDTIKDFFHQSRNNYDKVGHFAQGFVPAMICREILIRKNIVPKIQWLNVFTVAICMSISVCYEFLEWGVAVATGENADAFLGSQGDIWDTQGDMLYATIGAASMIILLGKIQQKTILTLNITSNS